MRIDNKRLKLIDYEGAGNRTPVLDISSIVENPLIDPLIIRQRLEKNPEFRDWLKNEGLRHRADSVMIYYRVNNSDYDFVTFIGEPNSPLENPFSEMCGNGIRSLALHIGLSEADRNKLHHYLANGINIWAGSIRNIAIRELDLSEQSAMVSVNLGRINTSLKDLATYLNTNYFPQQDLSQIRLPKVVTHYLVDREFGIGFNGHRYGEPHLVLINNLMEYQKLVRAFNLPDALDEMTIIANLRVMVSAFGKRITFNKDVFPAGINFNIALVLNGVIYVSTHERNMSSGQADCSRQIIQNGSCVCNTMACGTGGAIVSAIAKKQRYVNSDSFTTVHPGGEIFYEIKNNHSIMSGPAKRTSGSLRPSSLSKTFLME